MTTTLSSPEKDKWLKAMEEELESMKTNKIWILLTFQKDVELLGISEFSKLSVNQMGQYRDTRLDWCQKVLSKKLG